ncbi:uncharacterized protein Dwil_GK16563 [Drosophila willistoni]|uniref:RIIa domain-containing protein n=2 Tax=Drosophila willistoni TaxID=7260 RepID=B4MN50_DROWI|nr:uncharacterized protein Dwil_GK16563 [Drosophila willistoni]
MMTRNTSEKLEAQNCNRPKNYSTPAEKRSYLELKVTPVLMEGMLGLARDQPTDPVSYLEEYWLKEQHKCNINLTQNSI